MKTTQKNPALLALVSLLALTTTATLGAAGAGAAVGSTVNTATGTVNGAVQGAVGSGTSNPASAMGASSFGSATAPGGAAATVDAAGNPIPGTANANESESIGMRRERLQTEGNASNDTTVNAKGVNLSGTGTANASFDAAPAARSIRGATFATRDRMETDVKEGMSQGHRAMVEAKARAERLDDKARADFKAATNEVAVREKQLKASAKAASKASAENWEAARAKLAADQEAYAQAVAQAQAQAAQVSVNGTVEGGKR